VKRLTMQQIHGVWGAIGILLMISVLKTIAVGATLHSGFRGGFIFPLFFIGAATGLAISLALGTVFSHVPVAAVVLCMMAATNVAVTKTPISTAVILTSLSGTALFPAVTTACIASFILTSRVSLIQTQRSRNASPAF
jgi:H+/Cl- antiporter ClcA